MAASSVIGSLRVALGLDSAQFTQGAKDAEKRAEQLGFKIGRALRSPIDAATSLKGALTGLAGALALKELAGATQRAFDYADAIQDLSDRSGASTKAIQEFRYAAQLSGSSVEVADAATEKFARTLGLAQQGSDAQVKLFKSLGVTSSEFDVALRQTLDGIAKLPTVQQRAAVGFQIFGKSSATLTGLLGQGSRGFDELASRARELGIVLGDDVIRNAGGANDKLDTLKMILNAQFANAVTQNANSIVSLADGITKLTSSVLNFLNSNPQTALAIIGGLAGSRAGPVGAAVGAVGGAVLGKKLGQNAADGNMDLNFRRQAYYDARREQRARDDAAKGGGLFSIRKRNGSGDGSAAETERQRQLYQNARAAARSGKAPGLAGIGALPTTGTSEGATAAKAAAAEAKRLAAERKRAAEKAAQDEARYEQDLGRSRDEQLRAQLDLTVDQTERVNIQQSLLDNETATNIQAIQNDRDLTAEQKAQLIEMEQGTAHLRARALHQQDQEVLAQQALNRAQAANDNEQDILQAQAGLARTAKERGQIEAQILDRQFETLRLIQQAIIDSKTSSAEEKQLASDRIATLSKLQTYGRAKSARDNAGPLQQFADSLPRSADEVNEALERVQVDGISTLIDGLSDVEGGFKGLAKTVEQVSNQIISSLIKIGLQKGIAAIFGSLFGNAAASSSGGIFSSGDLFSSGSVSAMGGSGLPNLSGYRAKGGSVIAGRAYMVGERGPEPFIPGKSGTIIPNDMMMGGRGVQISMPITFSGGIDLATKTEALRFADAARQAAMQGVMEAQRRRG